MCMAGYPSTFQQIALLGQSQIGLATLRDVPGNTGYSLDLRIVVTVHL